MNLRELFWMAWKIFQRIVKRKVGASGGVLGVSQLDGQYEELKFRLGGVFESLIF